MKNHHQLKDGSCSIETATSGVKNAIKIKQLSIIILYIIERKREKSRSMVDEVKGQRSTVERTGLPLMIRLA